MGLRKALAHTVMHLSRWTFAPEFPLPDRCLVIGAPHTSNWDGFYMVMAMWAVERPVSFLVKKNLTDVPVIGSFVKAIGGIPVDREHPGHLVDHIISLAVIIAYDRLKIHLVVRILSTYNYIIIRIGPNQSGAIIVRYIQFLNIHNFPIVIDKQLQVLFRTQIDFISTTIDCSGKISE